MGGAWSDVVSRVVYDSSSSRPAPATDSLPVCRGRGLALEGTGRGKRRRCPPLLPLCCCSHLLLILGSAATVWAARLRAAVRSVEPSAASYQQRGSSSKQEVNWSVMLLAAAAPVLLDSGSFALRLREAHPVSEPQKAWVPFYLLLLEGLPGGRNSVISTQKI